MGRKLLATGLALFAGFALFGGSQARATTYSYTFTNTAAFPICSSVTSLSDLAFSLSGGADTGSAQIAYYTGEFGGGGLSNSNNCGEYPTANELVATFTTPVSDVEFTFDDEGYNGGNSYYAYDASGALLTSGALDPLDPIEPLYDLSAFPGIKTLVWANGCPTFCSNWTQALKTLTYSTTVPEPATLALLGAGLAGLGVTRRRRKTA
jgi:hypothetical protein